MFRRPFLMFFIFFSILEQGLIQTGEIKLFLLW